MKTTDVAQRIARGGISLILRQLINYVASFLAGVVLARLLGPEAFGVFAFVGFVGALSRILVDGGLSAALVQQHSEPTASERSTVFTVQFCVGLFFCLLLATLTPLLAPLLGSDPGISVTLYLAALSIAISPLVSICFVIVERRLDYTLMGLLLVVQSVTNSIVSAGLAWMGYGIACFGAGLLASTLIIVPLAIKASGPLPRFGFKAGDIKEKLHFSWSYIGSSLISVLKDAANPLFVAFFLGTAIAGYTKWAMQVAVLGAFLVMALSSMMFSGYARLRHAPEQLRRAVEVGLFWANAMTAPIVLLLLIFAGDFTRAVYGETWLPAVFLMRLLLLGTLLSPSAAVMMALMSALGRPKVSLAFTLMWFIATWVLVPLFSYFAGINAYGWANLAMEPIGLGLIVIGYRAVGFRWLQPITLPWLLGIIACLPAYILHVLVSNLSVIQLIGTGAASAALFGALIFVFAPTERRMMWTLFVNRRANA